jgi:hypothetical protein
MAVKIDYKDTWKIGVLAASTTDVPLNSVLPVIDTVNTTYGDRILLKDQTDPLENGIYVVQAFTLVKDTDNNVASSFVNGAVIRVLGGSVNINTEFYIAPITAANYLTTPKVFVTSPFGGGGGGTQTLSQTLGYGNSTAGNSIAISDGDAIIFNYGAGGNLSAANTIFTRSWQFPDQSGVIAMTSDIPDIYVATWVVDGNTNAIEKYIGTNDAFDLPFVTNANEVARFTTSGYFGIGTNIPTANLHVKSISNIDPLFTGTITIVNIDNISGTIINGVGDTYSFDDVNFPLTGLGVGDNCSFDIDYSQRIPVATNLLPLSPSLSYLVKIDDSTSNPLLYVRSDASVGIGTATPTAKLHVLTSSTDYIQLKVGNSNENYATGLELGTSVVNKPTIYKIGSSATGLASDYYDKMVFAYGNTNNTITTDFVFALSDNLSIGSTFRVVNDGGNLNNGFSRTIFGVYGGVTNSSVGVGMGSSIPTARLHVKGDANAATYALKVDNLAGNPLLHVRNDGNIGIGTDTPAAKLHVFSAASVVGADLLKVNNDFSIFTVNDAGYASYTGNNGFRSIGSNGIIDIVSNGGISPSLRFFYNNYTTLQSVLHGENNSMAFELAAGSLGLGIGYVGSAFTPGATLNVRGVDATNSGIALKVDNSAGTNLLNIRNNGAVGIGTDTPTAGTRLHVYRAVNDFLYEVKVENPTNGISAAASILIQSDNGKMEFGQLSTLFTTYSGYGQTGDTFIRSGTGARNMNFLTDPANPGKFLFFSRLNPTIDAATPSLAIDGLKVGIGTNTMTSSLQVVGLLEYTDNADALANGLTIGAFYRTGDLLKVVH